MSTRGDKMITSEPDEDFLKNVPTTRAEKMAARKAAVLKILQRLDASNLRQNPSRIAERIHTATAVVREVATEHNLSHVLSARKALR